MALKKHLLLSTLLNIFNELSLLKRQYTSLLTVGFLYLCLSLDFIMILIQPYCENEIICMNYLFVNVIPSVPIR